MSPLILAFMAVVLGIIILLIDLPHNGEGPY